MSKRTAEIAGVDVTVIDEQDLARQTKIAKKESCAATLQLLHNQLADVLVRINENVEEANEHTSAASVEYDEESDESDDYDAE